MPKAMKRPNNAGSVYKLSGRRRKPWVASISIGYDEDGRRTRHTSTHSTKAEALQALALYEINPIQRPNIKMSELYEEWSASKFKKISKSTADNYRDAYNKFQPLHNMKFNDLRTIQFQNCIDEHSNQSKSALAKMRTLAGLLYKYAMQHDICNKNYAIYLTLPQKVDPEKENFSIKEIEKLIKHDKDHVVKIILSMIFLGFRPSAALKLRPESYDIGNQIIRGGIKTEAGINRPVAVHEIIRGYLSYFLAIGGTTLLCKPDGSPYTTKGFREDYYYDALKKVGVRKLTPHKCRHTLESLMLNSGCDKVAILKTMGHKDFAFSVNTYGHADYEFLHKEMSKINLGG